MTKDWTDIVQAIAAIIAIPGAIAGFIALFRKSKEQQKQIDRLTEISESLKSMVITSRENLFLRERKDEYERKILEEDTKPCIVPGSKDKIRKSKKHTLHLRNKGEDIEYLNFEVIKGNVSISCKSTSLNYDKDTYLTVFAIDDENLRNLYIEINILMTNKYKHTYSQKVILENGDIHITEPEKVENE